METIKARLTSRKLWLALGGIAGLTLVASTGNMEWSQAMEAVKAIIMTYIATEGTNDVLKTIKK